MWENNVYGRYSQKNLTLYAYNGHTTFKEPLNLLARVVNRKQICIQSKIAEGN